MLISRRRLFIGAAALAAAPSIVRASSLMPISVLDICPPFYGDGIRSDLPHLQWLTRHAKPGEKIVLRSGRTYFLGGSIDVTGARDVTIEAAGARIDMTMMPADKPAFLLRGKPDGIHIRLGTLIFGDRRAPSGYC